MGRVALREGTRGRGCEPGPGARHRGDGGVTGCEDRPFAATGAGRPRRDAAGWGYAARVEEPSPPSSSTSRNGGLPRIPLLMSAGVADRPGDDGVTNRDTA